MKIVTHCEFPPIPVRDYDWIAYEEGQEECGRYGYGKTEAEAIADFIENHVEDAQPADIGAAPNAAVRFYRSLDEAPLA